MIYERAYEDLIVGVGVDVFIDMEEILGCFEDLEEAEGLES